ncbi:MAG: biotin transporter BioY [Eubacteriales bacterium]|nr:biotin transporter BioY [Eubacteriales bacterium]MDD3883103.1 biotin transporter BioY [Eubacteriales bacterium]MDD4513327.1 biotin transporter BioY [Eubacteriales bacterium]
MIICALMCALTAVSAFIRIPIPGTDVVFSMQVLMVLLCGAVAGPAIGALSQALYVALGLIGLPIFTTGGGFSCALNPSFGYLLGFILGAFVTGLVSRGGKESLVRFILASLAGVLAIYSVALPYIYILKTLYLSAEMPLSLLISAYFLAFLPLDAVKALIAAFAGRKICFALRKAGLVKGR